MLARIFIPQHVVLVNQKLEGYWLVTKDTQYDGLDGFFRISRFNKCKKADREAKACTVTSMYVDSAAINKNKLSKDIKANWDPIIESNYWVERKRDKETKMAVIHFQEKHEIMINVLKKEITVYLDTLLVYQAKKLK